METIFIYGDTGFVGRNLVEGLTSDKDSDVFVVGYSTSPQKSPQSKNYVHIQSEKNDDIYGLLNKYRPNHIYHLAAIPSVNSSFNTYYHNRLVTMNLLHAVEKYLYKTNELLNIIYLSSMALYGNLLNGKDDVDIHDVDIKSYYAQAKYEDEMLITRMIKEHYNLTASVIRPCALAGRYNTKGVVYDVCRKLKSDSEKLELFSNSVKPIIHIDIMVTILKYKEIFLDADKKNNNIFAFSTLDNISVEDIAKIAMDELGIYKDIVWGESWNGDQQIINPKSIFGNNTNLVQNHTLVTAEHSVRAAILNHKEEMK